MNQLLKVISLLFLIINCGVAQNTPVIRFGNEWINYDAPHAKVRILSGLDGNEGIYRVTYTHLQNSGFPVTTLDPRKLQMFREGKEINIRVVGESDGKFDASDYIEFYGIGGVNTTIDNEMFDLPANNTNPYRNVYENLGYYFVTIAPNNITPKRMPVVNERNSALAAEASHTQEVLYLPDNQYGFSNLYPEFLISEDPIHGALLSNFISGKGTGANGIRSGNSANVGFTFTNFIDKSPVALEMVFSGIRNNIGEIAISHNGKTVGTARTFRYEGTKFLGKVDSVILGANGASSGTFTITYANTATGNSMIRANYFKIGYRQGFAMAQSTFRKFNLDAKSVGVAKMQLTEVLPNTRFYDITDAYNVRFIGYDSLGESRTVVVNNATTKRTIVAENRVIAPLDVFAVSFTKINPDLYNYLIIAQNNMFTAAGGFPNAIQAYADYRASQQGGNFAPLVISANQIFDQFGGGFFTPQAFRRFADFMTNQSKNRMRGMFLVGKGIKLSAFLRSGNGGNNIPPYGFPASDNEMVNGLFGQSRFTPAIPIGRLSVTNPNDLINYLNKVKEHEALPAGLLWRKNILHLAGGTFEGENRIFKSYTDSYKFTAENGTWGMNVKTIQKTTTEYVERVNVRDEVNNGVSLITLFGHSSFEFSDIEISHPQDVQAGYNNKGKYCMILQNGCSGGDAFINGKVANSELWLSSADKGALAYVAHSHLGFDGYLNLYTSNFYQVAFADKSFINATIGEIMQETARRVTTQYGGDIMAITQAQQTILQGDPVLVMFGKRNSPPFPDFVVTNKDISVKTFNSIPLTAALDSFRICMAVTNGGSVTNDPLRVSVIRTFSDLTTITYPTVNYPAVRFRDTLCYTIVTPKELRAKATGLNRFQVVLDVGNQIFEIDEDNNSAAIEVNLKRAVMLPIAPKEYSIVSKQPVFFVAQNADLFTKERTYRFQLDTSANFNSAFRKDTVLLSYITPQWTTNLLSDVKTNDSTVYYWRVRYANLLPEDDTTWATSSFVYIKDSPSGWSQSRFPQFTKNSRQTLNLSVPQKRWTFDNLVSKIDFKVFGYSQANNDWKNYYININGELYAYQASCTYNDAGFFNGNGFQRLIMIAIDRETGKVYNPMLKYGNFQQAAIVCGANSLVAALSTIPLYKSAIKLFIDDVKTGDYVIVMPSGTTTFSNFTDLGAFQSIGMDMTNIDQRVLPSSGYLFIGQKGGQKLYERICPPGQNFTDSYSITSSPTQGTVTSTLIGPAASWGNVFRQLNGVDAGVNDKYKLDILGQTFDGREEMLFSDVKTNAFDIKNVSPQSYPYLRLRVQMRDSVRRTPYQLQSWQVVYKEVPEGILLYDTLTYRENTVLQVVEGDSIKLRFNFLNVTGTDFPDALTVQYKIRNVTTGRDTTIILKETNRLLGNQFQTISLKLNSLNFKGDNILTVFVNPRILGEQLYENNVLEARFKVKPDDINPVLEVAFDGKHLLNGDIVSPNPLISITLKDENRFLIKRDTIGMDIFLKACDNCTVKRINFNDPNLIWTPASEGNGNKFLIEYRPTKLANGTYTLSIQGKDVTGNISGKQPYQITFKVINENTVTNFYPYPNPFSTNTRFVFTLTGEIPDQIRIQIMTITGKVVKTLFKEDLGNLRIGQNITDYAWDGTDEFGDQLANGVYLYKVDVKSANKDYEHSNTSGDNLFKNGYGKMYLMR